MKPIHQISLALAIAAVVLGSNLCADEALQSIGHSNGRDPEKVSVQLQMGHSDEVDGSIVTCDHRYIVTFSKDALILVRDVATGRVVRQFHGTGKCLAIAVSDDSRYLAAAFEVFRSQLDVSSSISIWNLDQGTIRNEFPADHIVNCLAWSSDSEEIVTAGKGGRVNLWQASTGTKIATHLKEHENYGECIYSKDDKHVLLESRNYRDSCVSLLRWIPREEKVEQVVSFPIEDNKWMSNLDVSPDRKRVLLANAETSEVALYDLDTSRSQLLKIPHRFYVCRFSFDGSKIVTGQPNGQLSASAIDRISFNPVLRTRAQSRYFRFWVLPDDRVLTRHDELFCTWSVNGEETKFQNFSSVITSLDAVKEKLAVGYAGETAALWNLRRGEPSHILSFPNPEERAHCREVKLNHRGTKLLLAYHLKNKSGSRKDSQTLLFDLASPQKKIRLWGDPPVSISSKSDFILAAIDSGFESVSEGLVWHNAFRDSTEEDLYLDPEVDRVDWTATAALPNSDHVMIFCRGVYKSFTWDPIGGGAIKIDLADGKLLREYAVKGFVQSGDVSDDGKLMVMARVDHDPHVIDNPTHLEIRDQASGRLVQSTSQTQTVTAVKLSSNGRLLLTGQANGSATLWNTRPLRKIFQLSTHAGEVTSVQFCSNDRLAVTGSVDGSVRLWSTSTGDELCQLVTPNAGRDWLVVTPDGLFDGSEGGIQKVMFRVGNGLNVVPVSRFFQDFYHPGLLAEIWRGERPLPRFRNLRDVSLPPKIRITSPEINGEFSQQTADVSVEISDLGGGIGWVRLRQNGAVVATAEPQTPGKSFRHTFEVRLVAGENRFRVEAANGDGSFESEPALRTLHFSKSLPKPNLYVVAVGINDYAEDSLKLNFAASDARSITELFQERAGALYAQIQITELLNEQATKQHIRDAIHNVAEKAQEQDTLLVYFSGHGVTVGQRYFFVPQDLRHQSRRFEDDVEAHGYPGDQIARDIGEIRTLRKVMVLDTCNSGAGISLSHVKRRNPWAFNGAIRRLSRNKGIHILAAATANEDTIEIRRLGHGALTYSLLSGMQAVDSDAHADGNEDGLVSVMEWFSFASEQVPKLTKQYLGTEQNVQVQGEGGVFPVLPLSLLDENGK